MSINSVKIAVIVLLASLLVTYTNCGKSTALVFQSNIYGGSSESSIKAFEATVYPITHSNCVSCHSEQAPKHAADDVKVAHDAVISAGKVNFSDVSNSRLVKKLRDDNHNCWGTCSDNADEMEAAIEEWKNAIKDSGPATTPTDKAVYTEETSTMEMEFADSSNPLKTNSVKLNIEAAMLKAPMVLTKPAGAEAYLSVPNLTNNTLQANDANAGLAYFNFTVPSNGQYRLWGLVQGPADADNSFFVNITNTTTKATVVGGAKTWDIGTGTRFEWKQAPNIAPNLVAGTMYTVELRQREDGARLAGFIITSDTNFNGQEIGDYFGITLSFDLSGALKIPGVSFQIDVIDYDPYSYKVSRPRIVSSGANVYVKGVKLLVNNNFNHQHATYTIVDKLVTPTDSVLSDYSMVVLKDKGPAGDHFKFSFDQLSASGAGGSTGGGNTGTTGGGTGTQTSLMAFQSTVYPISRSSAYSCVGCHMSVSPRHASDNTLTAHDAALTVVDFNNPAASRIVNKMKVERHNCGAQCDNLATQYQNAILEWKNKRQ